MRNLNSKYNLMVNDFVKEVGRSCDEHGFRELNTKPSDYISLIHSEVSEIYDEFRHGHGATDVYYVDGKPMGVPVELADTVIACCDMADYFGIDLERAIALKHEYNDSRPYLNGKKF